jgi:hypothetical protein
VSRRTIKRSAGKRRIHGKDFLLAEEIEYIRSRAAEHDGRLVTVGPLVLFSTETGDAWLLDPADSLAARVARDGDPEDVHFEETDTNFAIGWKGNYQILAMPSSSSTATPPVSLLSSAIPPASSLRWPDRKFQICLASFNSCTLLDFDRTAMVRRGGSH